MPHLEGPLLQAYLDGYCNDACIAEVESHIESYDECRQQLDVARPAATRPGAMPAPAPRANRARAVEELRTDLPVAADRDAVGGGFLNLPATVREPDGRAAYTWLEDGYLLRISGAVDPDLLRGLADRIR
jgi:anti-sigma factor RsiW